MEINDIPGVCTHEHCNYQVVTERAPASFLWVLLYVILAYTLIGLPLAILLAIMRQKSNTVTYKVCQDCGKRWKV